MKLHCIVIEDELIARNGVENFIKKIDILQFVGGYSNPIAAMEILQSQKIDLIFLDIRMPEMSGLAFLKTLTNPPAVIITTAYSNHAVEGFELNVTDYLVKPFSFERFLTAVNKVKMKNSTTIETIQTKDDYLFIKCENKIEKIFFNDILFIEALENYVIIQTEKRKYVSYLTLKSVEDYLPETQFVKVHKSYIVSILKINSIEGNTIKINNYSISFSRNNKEDVLNLILKNKILKR